MRAITMLTLACLCVQTLTAAVDMKGGDPFAETDSVDAIDATPFEQSRSGIIVDVRLNGRGPFKFLFDTGSSHSAISADLVTALGVIPVARTVVTSPIGEHVRTIVQLRQLEIGPTVTNDVMPSVIPADAEKRIRGFQGLIGQDVLASKRYTIDFRHRRVLWHRRLTAGSLRGLPLESASGRALVTLPQRTTVLRLVPDSAAEALVLFRHRNLALVDWSAGAELEVATLLERRSVQHVTLRELRIGSSTLFRLPAVIVPNQQDEDAAPRDGRAACDGLLPLRLFERVTFDGPGRLIFVEEPHFVGMK